MKKIITLALLLSAIIIHAQPGSLDSSFGQDGKVINRFSNQYYINRITLQNDGKIVAAGTIGNIKLSCIIARYNADGSFDKTFANNGKLITAFGKDSSGEFNDITIQQDGKIVVTGSAYFAGVWYQLMVLRYNKNGTPDFSFGDSGVVVLHNKNGNFYGNAVRIEPDGKIVILGDFPDRTANINYMLVARLLPNGKLDSSFNGTGKSFIPFGLYTYPASVELQNDGKIVGTGSGDIKDSSGLTYEGVALFRLNTNGNLDKSFGNGGKIVVKVKQTNQGNDLKILKNGKIAVAGIGYDNDYFSQDQLLLRFNVNGFIDSSFGTNGIVITDFGKADKAVALDVQTNGKIVVGGSSFDYTSSTCTLVRYLANGALDNSFGNHGKVVTTFNDSKSGTSDLVIQPDGKIVTANAAAVHSSSYGVLARYIGNATAPVAQQQNKSSLLSSVKMFPNPVKDILSIENLPASETKLTIINNAGNVCKVTVAASSNFYWKVNDLKPGEYYLSIQNNDEKKSFLFLKQ